MCVDFVLLTVGQGIVNDVLVFLLAKLCSQKKRAVSECVLVSRNELRVSVMPKFASN